MRKLQNVFMALAALCFAIPAFADGGSGVINMAPIGVGLGMGLAAGLCGLGQGAVMVAQQLDSGGTGDRLDPTHVRGA